MTLVKPDGTVLEWTGLEVCACTHCFELFSNERAFDYHLKRRGERGIAKHSIKGMRRNSKGHLTHR